MPRRRMDHDECRRLYAEGWTQYAIAKHFRINKSCVFEAINPEFAKARRTAYYAANGHIRRISNRFGLTFPEARKFLEEYPGAILPNEQRGERLCGVLFASQGKVVTYRKICDALYFDRPSGIPDTWKRRLRSMVGFWRKRLWTRGYVIECEPRRGYRVVSMEQLHEEQFAGVQLTEQQIAERFAGVQCDERPFYAGQAANAYQPSADGSRAPPASAHLDFSARHE